MSAFLCLCPCCPSPLNPPQVAPSRWTNNPLSWRKAFSSFSPPPFCWPAAPVAASILLRYSLVLVFALPDFDLTLFNHGAPAGKLFAVQVPFVYPHGQNKVLVFSLSINLPISPPISLVRPPFWCVTPFSTHWPTLSHLVLATSCDLIFSVECMF